MAASESDVIQAVMVTAEIYGRPMSETAARVYLTDLSGFSPDLVVKALGQCRRTMPRFPSTAEVIERINAADGRPGPEEAWAMIPKTEEGSVIWTEEMSEAFGVARHLIAEDHVAARMAFREAYVAAVNRARERKIAPSWSPSFGTNQAGRATAIREALEKNRLLANQAEKLLPDFTPPAKSVRMLVDHAMKALPPGDRE